MKKEIEKLYYTAQDPKTYLVAALAGDAEVEEYCIEMAQRNSISGLLPMQERFLNGSSEFLFDITGKSRLIDVFKSLNDYKSMTYVLHNCCTSLIGLYDYFLHPSQCILDADYIFIGDKQQVVFALIPIKTASTECSADLKDLFLGLVGSCAGVSDKDKADILGYLIKPNFSIQEFCALLEKTLGIGKLEGASSVIHRPVSSQEQREAPDPAAASAFVPTPQPKVSPKPFPDHFSREAEKASASEDSKKPANEIQIPGGGKVVIPAVGQDTKKDESKKQKQQKENKGFLGGLFGKKKEEPLNMDVEGVQIQGGIATPPISRPPVETPVSIRSDSAGQWKGTIELSSSGIGGKTEFMGETSSAQGLQLIHNGRRIAVTTFPFTIGRELCSYTINNPKVSRQHLTISFEDGVYTVSDNNSKNHTYYDGSMLAPYTTYELKDGIELKLGNEILQVTIK